MNEQAEIFGAGHRLVGISTHPSGDLRRQPAVLLLNAGLIHRIGPRRLHVHLARRLAEAGRFVLRLDLSGIGDSDVRRDGLATVPGVLSDVREAMDHLAERYGIEQFVLFGICSGARAAFSVARVDERVRDVILVDPGDFGFEEGASLVAGEPAVTQHYVNHYVRMVRSRPLSRRRVLGWISGKANYRYAWKIVRAQMHGLFSGRRELRESRAHLIDGLLQLEARRGRCLLVFTDTGPSLDFYRMTVKKDARAKGLQGTREEVLIGADHDLSAIVHQERLMDFVAAWAHESILG